MILLNFINEQDALVDEQIFNVLLKKINKIMKKRIEILIGGKDFWLNCIITNDQNIRILNGNFRRKDEPTDVLSFPYIDRGNNGWMPNEKCIGEVFISCETAKKQAKDKKHSPKKELQILFVHGVLHILGFDHRNDQEEKEMEDWAKRVMASQPELN